MLILSSVVTDCVSISAFASLVAIPVRIASSAVGIKICANTGGIKKYKSIIKKKKKKYDKVVLLEKDKLNTIEVLISKVWIDSYISHDEFVSVNFCGIHYIKTTGTYCASCKKNTENENSSAQKTKQNRLMLLSNCAV